MDSLVLRALFALTVVVTGSTLSAQALVRPLLAVSDDARSFVVTNPDGNLQLREVSTGELLAQWKPPLGLLRSVSFAKDSKTVEIASSDGKTGTWNWEASKYSPGTITARLSPLMLEGSGSVLSAPAMGVQARVPDGTSLLWSALPNEEVLVLATDRERWAAGTASGRVYWGRFSDGIIEQSWAPGHGPVVALAPAGDRLWIVLSGDFTVALWDRFTSQKVGSFGL